MMKDITLNEAMQNTVSTLHANRVFRLNVLQLEVPAHKIVSMQLVDDFCMLLYVLMY